MQIQEEEQCWWTWFRWSRRFFLLSIVFIVLAFVMKRMRWILVIGPLVLLYLPQILSALCVLACIVLLMVAYLSEGRTASAVDGAKENDGSSEAGRSWPGCQASIIAILSILMLTVFGLFMVFSLGTTKVYLDSSDIQKHRTVTLVSQFGWTTDYNRSHYYVAPYSVIAQYGGLDVA